MDRTGPDRIQDGVDVVDERLRLVRGGVVGSATPAVAPQVERYDGEAPLEVTQVAEAAPGSL